VTVPVDHDAYIAAAPEAFRPILAHLRRVLAEALPDAEAVIAYGLPGFRLAGQTVAGYAAFSRQCGLYLLPEAIAAHGDELAAAGFKTSKTGVTFTAKKPIPDDLVARLATASRDQALKT
jgi:uncharacterized protein YdhG (YjbR/CyaY superfamily)